MRMFVGLLCALLIYVGPVGDLQSQDDSRVAEASQASPPSTPKCIVPPDAVGGCHISKHNQEFIHWKAPATEAMNVCFQTPFPFEKQNYHIPAGHEQESGPIVLQPPPPKGKEFDYYYGPNRCPSEKHRNTAKVIVED